MSRLIDKLDRLNKAASQPMGFRATRDDLAGSTIILVASIDIGPSDEIRNCVAGADALFLQAAGSSLPVKSVGAIVKSLSGIPCGIRVEDTGKAKMDGYIQAGCDFLVFSAESPIGRLPRNEKIGKLLLLDPSIDDSLVRSINNLPVDAVITTDLSRPGDVITWHHLMAVQRLALLLTKPVLIPVSSGISPGELEAIREAGIDGILVEASTSRPGRIEEIRQIITQLPPPSAKKHGKSDVLLPRNSGTPEPDVPDEDDDYE